MMNITTYLSTDVKMDSQKKQMYREAKKAKMMRKKLRQQVPIVTIPGFKGSVLEREDGTVVWLTAAQASGYNTPNIALPMKWHDGVQETDDIHAIHTLKAVTVIPYLYEPQIYGEWIRKITDEKCHSYEFSYDWRRSLLETLGKFLAYLRWISAKHNGKKIQVVAHSMGGLLTLAALNIEPDLFHSILFAGVPFRGGPGLVEDLHMGTTQGRNEEICAPKIVMTFPAVFQVACSITGTDADPEYTGLLDENDQAMPMNWFDLDLWRKHKLGPFSNGEPSEEFIEHLKNTFRDGLEFRKYFDVRLPKEKYPPITVIGCDTIPTLRCFKRNGPMAVKGWDVNSTIPVPGDGRLPITHVIPRDLPHKFFPCDFEHMVILDDPSIIGHLENMLEEVSPENLVWHPPFKASL